MVLALQQPRLGTKDVASSRRAAKPTRWRQDTGPRLCIVIIKQCRLSKEDNNSEWMLLERYSPESAHVRTTGRLEAFGSNHGSRPLSIQRLVSHSSQSNRADVYNSIVRVREEEKQRLVWKQKGVEKQAKKLRICRRDVEKSQAVKVRSKAGILNWGENDTRRVARSINNRAAVNNYVVRDCDNPRAKVEPLILHRNSEFGSHTNGTGRTLQVKQSVVGLRWIGRKSQSGFFSDSKARAWWDYTST